mmetsp:Transcript_53193/g.146928  ORF Transcript_53193/g.146928 Transcript_53193/m.146928 type:complete len:81 (-) Transcript_53193:1139-1381(-)
MLVIVAGCVGVVLACGEFVIRLKFGLEFLDALALSLILFFLLLKESAEHVTLSPYIALLAHRDMNKQRAQLDPCAGPLVP